MNMKTVDSLRKNTRRDSTRRSGERRVILHAFGSEEWLAMIKELYFFWPKKDQRVKARREKDRREVERRLDNTGRGSLQKQLAKTVDSLTEEEMHVLNGLWTS